MKRPIDGEAYMELLKEQYLHHKSMGSNQMAQAWQGAMQLLYDMPTLTPPNEPLTLNELREMDGEPVWIEDVKHWALIDIGKGGQWDGVPFAVWAENGVKFTYNVESHDLHCYRRPPEGEEEA